MLFVLHFFFCHVMAKLSLFHKKKILLIQVSLHICVYITNTKRMYLIVNIRWPSFFLRKIFLRMIFHKNLQHCQHFLCWCYWKKERLQGNHVLSQEQIVVWFNSRQQCSVHMSLISDKVTIMLGMSAEVVL